MMYKTTFFCITSSAIILCALFSCSPSDRENKEQDPNIIIIYADDLGYGDVSSYGGDIPTPHIDRIGKEGIRFTDFYVSAPSCTPSRFSLLTGSYPQRSAQNLTTALMPVNKNYLDTSETTIAAYLKTQGYSTAIMGKWHLGFRDSTDMPDIHGFDEFSGFRGGCIDYFHHVYGQMGHDWVVDNRPARETGYSTDLITDHAIDYIGKVKNEDAPFFLYLPYNAPHYGKTDPDSIPEHTTSLNETVYQGYGIINSLQVPAEYLERFTEVKDPYRRTYAAMVSCLDDNIGRLLAQLEKDGLLENTMIWFISDNGGYNESYYGHSDNGGLHGEKGTLWEGGIRVPAMVSWKNRIEPGKEITAPASNLDILPTLASLLGFEAQLPAGRIDGQDISGILFGEPAPEERTLFWKYGKQTALRKGGWKLLNGEKLYDLASDRNETIDLAQEHPEKVQELRELFNGINATFDQ